MESYYVFKITTKFGTQVRVHIVKSSTREGALDTAWVSCDKKREEIELVAITHQALVIQ